MSLFRTRQRFVIAIVVLLLLTGGAMGYWYFRTDPQVALVQALRQDMRSEENKNLSAAERRARWNQFRQEVEKLTVAQRQSLRGDRGQRFKDELAKFFKMPDKEKLAFLDSRIDRMEEARKERANTNQNGPNNPRGWGGGTPEDRENRRKQRLDMTSPEDRAMMAEFRKEMAARMQQRGGPHR